MKPPLKLYRYRPLNDEVFEGELSTLRDSYLYCARFLEMNDPMEASYEINLQRDERRILGSLGLNSQALSSFRGKLADTINSLALLSFSTTHPDLPMWAYYASNFSGMCLEFQACELSIGDLQNEKLRPVSYRRSPLPPLNSSDMLGEGLEDKVNARLTRKRIEWQHEHEWRFITGEQGRRHYVDDALLRVFLGPRVKPEHADQICQVLDRRPVEVLQGEICWL